MQTNTKKSSKHSLAQPAQGHKAQRTTLVNGIKRAHQGIALFEMALTLALAAAVLVPVMAIQRSQRIAQAEALQQQTHTRLQEAIEGFVLARGRLPCPAATASDTTESRANGQCTTFTGWVPYASLGLTSSLPVPMVVANLSQAGAPAAFALTAEKPLMQISPQQLAEVVYAPPTPSAPVGHGPLPALHLCQWAPQVVLPNPNQAGCGNLPSLSHSAVLVVLPNFNSHSLGANPTSLQTANANRILQFMVSDQLTVGNPIALTFERLNWLWLQSGALSAGG